MVGKRMRTFVLRAIVLAASALGAVQATQAATPVVSMPMRLAPANEADVVAEAPSLGNAPLTELAALPVPALSEGVAKAAQDGRDVISFGRDPLALGVDGVVSAYGVSEVRVRVTSATAKHLRTAWVFSDDAHYTVTVIAGLGSARLLTNTSDGQRRPVWSAVTTGETQDVLIRRQGEPSNWSARLERVAHFDKEISPSRHAITPRQYGDSAACQVDMACVLDAADAANPAYRPAILEASRAVAIMIVTTAGGSSGTCTGTLLNSANYPLPLFITANHCIEGIATLDTVWFYSRATCGYGVPTSLQSTGGAGVVWKSADFDSALLLLGAMPPAGVSYAGWNATPVPPSSTIIAIHHPRGDVKKGSFGTVLGTNGAPVTIGSATYSAGTFYGIDWEVGIVEPGSSGSGFFTGQSNPTFALSLRGTLTGGSTACSSAKSRTFYSRLDNVFPYIAGPLTVPLDLPSTAVAVEYFHAAFGHYFVSSDADEIAKLDSGAFAGWARTGQSFKVYTSGAGLAEVCRFFTVAFAPKSSHFYTPIASECSTVKGNPDWTYEKIAFKLALPVGGTCPSQTLPLYRLYNNGMTKAPNHRYTTSTAIRSQMIAQGFVPEDGNMACVPQ